MQKPLPLSFYTRDTLVVAKDLLGKILVRKSKSGVVSARIVETEAYLGSDDPSSHAYRGPTLRAAIMFGAPGRAYVYFIYGNHFCFNVVAHNGGAGAVLVRALEPLEGLEEMFKRRKVSELHQLTNGPGKLTQAMGITREHNGIVLNHGEVQILDAPSPHERIYRSPRIGIRVAKSWLYRFALKGNPFVSKK